MFYVFQPLILLEVFGTHERVSNCEKHLAILEVPAGMLCLEGAWRDVQHGGNPIGGNFYGFEVKTERGKPTALQEATMRKIRLAGGIAVVVRSVADVKAVLEGRDSDG